MKSNPHHQVTNGLDSSSALDIVRTIRAWGKNFAYTCAVSLLQPAPEVYALFDEVRGRCWGALLCGEGETNGEMWRRPCVTLS